MDEKEKQRNLYREIMGLVYKEQVLRKKLGIGEQGKIIPSRLDALLKYVHDAVSLPQQDATPKRASPSLSENEQYAFVHLFNTNGKILTRWEAMLSPRQITDYSVNRPIYAEQKQVEAYIRSRPNSDEHAFLMMKILKSDVLSDNLSNANFDALEHPLLKLKEGALKEQGLVYFFHQGERYIFANGHLTQSVSVNDCD